MSAVLALPPSIGARIAGGIYAGTVGENYLVLAPVMPEPANWHGAMGWVSSLYIGGYEDWMLSDLAELRQLIQMFPELFQARAWWTRLTCAGAPDNAIIKLLMRGEAPPDPALVASPDDGEGPWGKQFLACAAAVRLVPIHGQRITARPHNTGISPAGAAL